MKKDYSFVEFVWKHKQSLGIGVTPVKSDANDFRVVEFLPGSGFPSFCTDNGMDPHDLLGAKIVGVDGNRYLNKADLYEALTNRDRPKKITFRLNKSSADNNTEITSNMSFDDDLTTDSETSHSIISNNNGTNNKKLSSYDLKVENRKLQKKFLKMEEDHATEIQRLIKAIQTIEEDHTRQMKIIEEKHKQELEERDSEIEVLESSLNLLRTNMSLIAEMNGSSSELQQQMKGCNSPKAGTSLWTSNEKEYDA